MTTRAEGESSASDHGVRAVVFDLGGVVVRIARSWEEGCDFAGLPVREAERFKDPALRAERRALSNAYQAGELTCEQYFERISAHAAGLYTADEIERIHRAWVREPYEGVADLVAALNQRDLLTACLSNTNHAHWQDLQQLADGTSGWRTPAIEKMRLRLVSHELRAVKPDQRIYRLAEAQLGVAGDAVVFFDDLEENVDAAQRVGWRAHQIDHTGDTAAQMREHLGSYGIVV